MGDETFVVMMTVLKRAYATRGGGVSESMDRQGCAILALELVHKNLIFA